MLIPTVMLLRALLARQQDRLGGSGHGIRMERIYG